MKETSLQLSVYFEEPFWRGLYERHEDNHDALCRITFGAEPKDQEIYEQILFHFQQLPFAAAHVTLGQKALCSNPKRRQREAAKALQKQGISTKAQQALQQNRTAYLKARQARQKERLAAQKEQQFLMRQQKKKARHRGR